MAKSCATKPRQVRSGKKPGPKTVTVKPFETEHL